MVADLAHIDAMDTGENRKGMFFAARTFAFKLGQSLALLLFTALATIYNAPNKRDTRSKI
jgi:GPH family glycoside/pentoside/hexuronide:cation symporter